MTEPSSAAPAHLDEPTMSMLLGNLAIELHGQRKVASANVMIRRALALEPDNYRILTQLAGALVFDGRYHEGDYLLAKAMRIEPNYHFAWNVSGFLAAGLGDFDDAVRRLDRALELDPTNGGYRFDLACLLLAKGDYDRGFVEYECRNRNAPWKRNTVPEWRGEPGAHVYVWSEQGMGDVIAFSRFIPWVASLSRLVTFAVPTSIHSLFTGFNEKDRCVVVPQQLDVRGYDYQVPLMSIPRLMGLTLADVLPPATDKFAVAPIVGEVASGPKKIGVCWAGNKMQLNDVHRSMPFTTMLRLAEDPRLRLFSFQIGERAGDIGDNRAQRLIEDWAGVFDGDWAGTAAALKQMDAIVTVCTGLAHLAASLGVPTYVCLHDCPYWIWGRGETTPWYPSARLFRQTKPGDWHQVIDRVKEALLAHP